MLKKLELEAANRGEGCLGKAADDEPVFILRAQDALAPLIVRAWADQLSALTSPSDDKRRKKAEDARKLAKDMEAWQIEKGLRKMPD